MYIMNRHDIWHKIIKNEYSKKEEIDEYFREREISRQKVKQWK